MLPEDYKFLNEILNYSPLATAIYDSPDLRIAFVNEAMLEMWCAKRDISGKLFSEVFPSFKESGFSAILENVWHSGKSYTATDKEAEILKDGIPIKRFFDFEYKALTDENNKTYAILHTSIDVTEKNVALKTIESHVQHLNYNNELELITNTLVHDAKNPISIARIAIENIRKKHLDQNNDFKDWLYVIEDALCSLTQIIDKTSLLSEARTYKIGKKVVHISEKVNHWINEAKFIHQVTELKIDLGELHPINAEPNSLNQVFSNLINNAIKYSSQKDQPMLSIDSERDENGIYYYIRDNGIGIPTAEMGEIFSNMHRASNAGNFHGNGIGLFIVKRMMEKLQGKIEVSSEINQGTAVKLYFPDN
ncbi:MULTISPECIES: PAS domain-containing sensor histidine kinase [Sphingobacterium]|uniref:sensor histidine kinase n=1 Tax=Sphingobacterium TaxID=28453 RepID=UPI0016259644|nr:MULTISPECIES: PAS domain-containing sensor histidine kinase [Sphingobacterium]